MHNAVTVKARAVRGKDGTWDLIILECPYCGGRHVHGGGNYDKPAGYGHREAHCVGYGNPGYILVPDGVEFAEVVR